MLEGATREELLAIIDASHNVSKRRFPLRAKDERRAKRYWETITRLGRVKSEASARRIIQQGEGVVVVHPKRSCMKKRLRVVQRGGGFLPALLIPVLADLAAEAVDYFLPDPDAQKEEAS